MFVVFLSLLTLFPPALLFVPFHPDTSFRGRYSIKEGSAFREQKKKRDERKASRGATVLVRPRSNDGGGRALLHQRKKKIYVCSKTALYRQLYEKKPFSNKSPAHSPSFTVPTILFSSSSLPSSHFTPYSHSLSSLFSLTPLHSFSATSYLDS
ncbi:MAG: hypothetical protein JOS17DRAFT_597483 [Linnemannia elongata]|nr:MAG: hypothetical protein JOS17DRAFT_597483 [Linnemannia elongata]